MVNRYSYERTRAHIRLRVCTRYVLTGCVQNGPRRGANIRNSYLGQNLNVSSPRPMEIRLFIETLDSVRNYLSKFRVKTVGRRPGESGASFGKRLFPSSVSFDQCKRLKMEVKRNVNTIVYKNRKHPVQYTCVHACEGEKCVFACDTHSRACMYVYMCFGLWPTFILKSYLSPPSFSTIPLATASFSHPTHSLARVCCVRRKSCCGRSSDIG